MTSSCNFIVVIVLLFHLVRPISLVFGVTENINNEEKEGNGEEGE